MTLLEDIQELKSHWVPKLFFELYKTKTILKLA